MSETKFYDATVHMKEEVLKAKAMSEIIRMLYTTACGHEITSTDIDSIENALWLIWDMFETHAVRLDELSKTVSDMYTKLETTGGTA